MVALKDALSRLREWEAEFEHGPPPRLDRKLVHKHHDENVFISRFEPVDADHPDDFVAQLYLDKEHPFFFEHPLDHYPGLMLVEAGRQLGTSVAHVHYDVPLGDAVFILNGMEVDFTSFAELDRPVFVNSTVSEKKFKRGALTAMFYKGHFVQNEQPIGYMSGHWNIYPKRAMQRMRRKAVQAGD